MAVYWVSFEIEYDDDASYGKRWAGLRETVYDIGTTVWEETTSLYVFDTDLTLDQVTAQLAKPLDLKKDAIIVKEDGKKLARIAGKVANQQSLKKLVPYIK